MALYVPGVPKKIFMRSHLASDITNRSEGRLPAVGACELYTFGKWHIRIMELTAKRAAVVQWLQTEFAVEQRAGVPPPNPSWKSFAQATAFPDRRGGRRYTGVKLLAGLSKDTSHYGISGYFKTLGIEGLALEPPQCLLGDAVDLVPIGIPSLRRKVNAAFSRLFAPKLTDLGSET
jgi:hypothetical protein